MATPAMVDRDAALPVLTRMVRAMFPHERFPDGPYERTAAAIIDAAADDPASAAALRQGLIDLDAHAGDDRAFAELPVEQATEVITPMAGTPLFELVKAKTVLTLYDDREVWELLGYEGESFSQGGYLERGFAELDWLPAPRVEGASA